MSDEANIAFKNWLAAKRAANPKFAKNADLNSAGNHAIEYVMRLAFYAGVEATIQLLGEEYEDIHPTTVPTEQKSFE